MALGVLNNISAVYAQNNLANTQASLSKTLQQLSSGSRINSGADDAAGLSLANGLQASATALSQSAKNASQGVDMLQVADGALSQVTNLLNRAVTLATEAANGTLNSTQQQAADAEYQKILGEVDTINSKTQYNGLAVFRQNAGSSNISIYTSDGSVSTSYNSTSTDLVQADTATLALKQTDKIALTGTLQHADATAADLTSTASVMDNASTPASHTLTILLTETGDHTYNFSLATSAADAAAGITLSGGSGTLTFDSTSNALKSITGSTAAVMTGITGSTDVSINIDPSALITGGTAVALATAVTTPGTMTDLQNATNAGTALTAISAAIGKVAADRGTIGANINTLSAVSNVMTTQSTNTLAAQNDVTATDYGQATSDMSKFQILSQTGIAALAQANQSQQLITKLLQ